MKPKLILVASLWLCAVFVGACAYLRGPRLHVRVGEKDSTLIIKSSGVYYGNVISTAPGMPDVQTFAHDIYLANYQMNTTTGATMRKALTAPDQMRVEIQLTGEAGTNTDSPFKVGTYEARADKFNSVRSIILVTFADGKEKRAAFDLIAYNQKADGHVKITSVTADSISGEVNLTGGDKLIKGTFTARLPVKK